MAPSNVDAKRSETQLMDAVDRYARLMRKAEKGRLQGGELDQLMLTALSMRKEARELGVTNRQLEQMLDNMVQYQTQRSS